MTHMFKTKSINKWFISMNNNTRQLPCGKSREWCCALCPMTKNCESYKKVESHIDNLDLYLHFNVWMVCLGQSIPEMSIFEKESNFDKFNSKLNTGFFHRKKIMSSPHPILFPFLFNWSHSLLMGKVFCFFSREKLMSMKKGRSTSSVWPRRMF